MFVQIGIFERWQIEFDVLENFARAGTEIELLQVSFASFEVGLGVRRFADRAEELLVKFRAEHLNAQRIRAACRSETSTDDARLLKTPEKTLSDNHRSCLDLKYCVSLRFASIRRWRVVTASEGTRLRRDYSSGRLASVKNKTPMNA